MSLPNCLNVVQNTHEMAYYQYVQNVRMNGTKSSEVEEGPVAIDARSRKQYKMVML